MSSNAERALLALGLLVGCAEGPTYTYALTATFVSTDCGGLVGQDEALEYGLDVAEDGTARLWADGEPFARGFVDPETSVLTYNTDTMRREADGVAYEVMITGTAQLDGVGWIGTESLGIVETDGDLAAPCSYVYDVEGACRWAR